VAVAPAPSHATTPGVGAAVSVVVADRHPITLEGVSQVFARAGLNVLTACRSGEEALRALASLRPDVFVFDIPLVGTDGLTVLRDMKSHQVSAHAVLFTSIPEEPKILEAIRLGVRGVVLKEMPPHMLVQCVKKVHTGEQWVEKRSAGHFLDKLLRREIATRQLALDLTARELEILRLVASGLRNKAIAERLFVTEGTVKIHLHNMFRKLQVGNRMALTLLAQSKGFV
jgi:DNA-binding NarL/FixJ family response regulator